MENQKNQGKPSTKSKAVDLSNPREKVYLGVITVLVIAVGILIFQLYQNKTNIQNITVVNNDLQTDKEQLTSELNDMLQQYNDLETNNKELQGEMLEQKQKIQDLLEDVKNNKANVATIRKFKKEVGTLRVIMKGYVGTIDSLNTMNQELMSENQTISTRLTETKKTNENLLSEKENLQGIVKNASRLQISEQEILGLRERSSGTFAKSSRASRIAKFETCFLLLENKTTNSGEKEVFVRLLAPDGSLIKSAESKEFKNGEEVLVSSASKAFPYNNKETDVCIYVPITKEIAEGEYTMLYYESGALIGSKKIELK
jgi:peptidoglycan hydrolase CwlO-like protein